VELMHTITFVTVDRLVGRSTLFEMDLILGKTILLGLRHVICRLPS